MENKIREIIRLVREKDAEVLDWCENRLYVEIAKIMQREDALHELDEGDGNETL